MSDCSRGRPRAGNHRLDRRCAAATDAGGTGQIIWPAEKQPSRALHGSHSRRQAAALALPVGVVLLLTSLLRLGWIADLLSIPVTTGFLAGISVHIVVGQLPTVLGIDAAPGNLMGQVAEIVQQLPHAGPFPVAIGLCMLAVSLLAERLDKRIPGALIGLAARGLAVRQLELEQHGVSVLGALAIAPPAMTLTFKHLLPLSLIVALVCVMQTAAVLQSFHPTRAGRRSCDFAAAGAGSILARVDRIVADRHRRGHAHRAVAAAQRSA
jgi:MFS superfamily sulfate permease-like transporter